MTASKVRMRGDLAENRLAVRLAKRGSSLVARSELR